MISIPKHIKFNDIELNDFWNDDTIYDYIVSHIKIIIKIIITYALKIK